MQGCPISGEILPSHDRSAALETPVFQAFPGFLAVLGALYTMNIASPKEKNRYRSLTASS